MSLLLRACPKCNGTLSPEEEFKGEIEYVCINCGQTVYLKAGEVGAIKRRSYTADPRDGRQPGSSV
jgi:Zn-finger nucleic acid-binding protein